ncbi:hypothetical protein, partial [Streptococcus suis]|uniref:hypothetical protein n=1 Tax=Streptococcus suis TaxID=1307 RepID=UPI001E57A431
QKNSAISTIRALLCHSNCQTPEKKWDKFTGMPILLKVAFYSFRVLIEIGKSSCANNHLT